MLHHVSVHFSQCSYARNRCNPKPCPLPFHNHIGCLDGNPHAAIQISLESINWCCSPFLQKQCTWTVLCWSWPPVEGPTNCALMLTIYGIIMGSSLSSPSSSSTWPLSMGRPFSQVHLGVQAWLEPQPWFWPIPIHKLTDLLCLGIPIPSAVTPVPTLAYAARAGCPHFPHWDYGLIVCVIRSTRSGWLRIIHGAGSGLWIIHGKGSVARTKFSCATCLTLA